MMGDTFEKLDLNSDETLNQLLFQVDFYFGAPNLSQDKFLRELLAQNTKTKPFNCVLFETLLGFNRVK